jgi:antitoxin Phd
MNRTWQLQEAKQKLSKVVDAALNQGPQIITRHGKEVVIVIGYERFRKMTAPDQKLSDFFLSSPLVDEELDLTRDKSAIRDEISL